VRWADDWPWDRSAEQTLRVTLMVVLVVVGLGWAALSAVLGQTEIAVNSAPSAVAVARARYAWDTCIQSALARGLPPGVPVYVVPKGRVYWQATLGPMSAPNHKVLTEPEPGAYSVEVVDDGPNVKGGIHCPGKPGTKYTPIALLVRPL
jgi:hypothetical protein